MISIFSDPFKVYYNLIIDDDSFEEMSPFQGFGASWPYLHWAMILINRLPADVFERTHDPVAVAAQRIGGLRPLIWRPMNISVFLDVDRHFLPPCSVALTGSERSAKRIEGWISENGPCAFHFTPEDSSVELGLNLQRLSAFCFDRLDSVDLNEDQRSLLMRCERNWMRDEVQFEHHPVRSHNISLPNYMTLERLGFTMPEGDGFLGSSEDEYTDLIMQTAGSVVRLRRDIKSEDLNPLDIPSAELILFEPAIFRNAYKGKRPQSNEDREAAIAMKFFQQQRGLYNTLEDDKLSKMNKSNLSTLVRRIRQEELLTQTLGVGLYAAERMTAVVRLSPAVNHVFNKLRFYSINARTFKPEAIRKSARLFQDIQSDLAKAIGSDRLEAIRRTSGQIKIISDAPIEWVPVDGLPLSFAKDCSRIPVTPGNVLMAQMIPSPAFTLPPSEFHKVLVISSFRHDDPLRRMMQSALAMSSHLWQGTVDLQQVFVDSVSDLEVALNSFDGNIVVFDCHGVPNIDSPIGKIAIGEAQLDVWSLKGKVRCPPIVILSACDTQGVDASTHATVGNGFLALGAITVLGTFLPVGGKSSAIMVARLMHRLAAYIPAMIKGTRKPITWLEVVSGMLRMSLATEVIDGFFDPGDVQHVRYQANRDINGTNYMWFQNLKRNITNQSGETSESVDRKVNGIISRSDSIRYTQLGNPEKIVIFSE